MWVKVDDASRGKGRVNLDQVTLLLAFQPNTSAPWEIHAWIVAGGNDVTLPGTYATQQDALDAIADLVGGGA